MSVIQPGDEDMHYSDGAHHWAAPVGEQQEAWEAQIRAHVAEHLATMGDADTGLGQPSMNAEPRRHLRTAKGAPAAKRTR